MLTGLRHRSNGKLRAKGKGPACGVLPAIFDTAEGLPKVFDLLCQTIGGKVSHTLSLLDSRLS